MGCRVSRREPDVQVDSSDAEETQPKRRHSKRLDAPIVDPDVDQNSAAAQLALRKASKDVHTRAIRRLSFEEFTEDDKNACVENEEINDSHGARLAKRKSSKNKVHAARRLSTGAPELDVGETPMEVAENFGVWVTQKNSDLEVPRAGSKASRNSRMSNESMNSRMSSNSGSIRKDRPSSKGSKTLPILQSDLHNIAEKTLADEVALRDLGVSGDGPGTTIDVEKPKVTQVSPEPVATGNLP